MEEVRLSWSKFALWCEDIIERLDLRNNKPDAVYGIARGGIVPAYFISQKIGANFYPIMRMKHISFRDPEVKRDFDEILIVDDRSQSGESLELSKQNIINIYHKRWNKRITVKTALLNSFKEIDEFPADYVVKKTTFEEKILFPWDSDEEIPSKHQDHRLLQEAFQKYKEARDFIDQMYNKNSDMFYETLSQTERELLSEFFNQISTDPVNVNNRQQRYHIRAKIIGLANLKEFEDALENLRDSTGFIHFDYSKDRRRSNTISAIYYLMINTLKSITFKYHICWHKSSYYLKIQPYVFFARCEPQRSEPHLFCYNNCNFKNNPSDPRIPICFGITSALLGFSKIKDYIGTAENLKIEKKEET
jgi:hypoxanthine phosphoribosyltransferase